MPSHSIYETGVEIKPLNKLNCLSVPIRTKQSVALRMHFVALPKYQGLCLCFAVAVAYKTHLVTASGVMNYQALVLLNFMYYLKQPTQPT